MSRFIDHWKGRNVLGIAELSDGFVRYKASEVDAEPSGVRIDQSVRSFELRRERPGDIPVYYRVDYGRLEWGADLGAFSGALAPPEPEPGALLAMIHGLSPPPDASPLQGVRRLSVGTAVRLDADGVTVAQRPPELTDRRLGLRESVGAVLASLPNNSAIAYSGGLSSAFVAVCAARAGKRPVLLHADFGQDLAGRIPVAEVPGLAIHRVSVDLSELLDHHRITGAELTPPLPDVDVPRQLMWRLAGAGGGTVVSGALLKDLLSARLAEAKIGLRGWRLLGAEPFHVSGSLRTLREARKLLASGLVHLSGRHDHGHDDAREPDAQPLAGPPPPTPAGGDGIPGLTSAARDALQSTRRSYQAVWNQHLDELPSVLGRVEAGLVERGLAVSGENGSVAWPALDPGVLAAVAGLPPSKICGLRRGAFRNHLPLRQALAAHGVAGVADTSSGFRLRLAAATHLHRERDKVIAELSRECAFADRGLIDLPTVIGVLRDGPTLAEHALPLLRLVWLDRWLRGR